jgi:3-phenylpropionate/trans-cinnamate dioxygenase ferredoxin component
MTDFIKAAEASELEEGELLPIEVDGELICLAMVEGTVYAFTDNCTHISGPLNEGDLEGYILDCPWHGAQFDIRTGKVVRGPARQDVMTYPVKVENDAIYIKLPDEE